MLQAIAGRAIVEGEVPAVTGGVKDGPLTVGWEGGEREGGKSAHGCSRVRVLTGVRGEVVEEVVVVVVVAANPHRRLINSENK